LALYRNSQNFSRAPAFDRLELGKLHQARIDFGRASTLELREGLPTGREAFRPSEPPHSPAKATPSYYTKNESLQVKSPKCGMCILISTIGGIYRVMRELHRLGEVGLTPRGGRPTKPRGWPAMWSSLHQLSPPPWPSTPLVDRCPQSRSPNRHKTWPAGQGVWPVGRPLDPSGLGFGPLGPCVKYTPVVMSILRCDQLYFVIP
jgi:hypothetical protein